MQACNHIHTNVSEAVDPTKTTSLRNQFSRDMDKRFNELVKFTKIAIVERDCFALRKLKVMQMASVADEEFDRDSYAEEIALFLLWLQRQVDLGILTKSQFLQIGRIVSQSWTDPYIRDAYERGIIRARQEMIKAGMSIPSIEASGGIEAVLANLNHTQRLNLLYASVFNELQGVTDAMRNQISKILSLAMIAGKSPSQIASEIRAVIDGTNMTELGITNILGRFIPAKLRAEMIARTEIIRAFAIAQLQEFKNWGVTMVGIKAEFRTARDAKVCPECGSMEGKLFEIDEAWGIIPVHPWCRCHWILNM